MREKRFYGKKSGENAFQRLKEIRRHVFASMVVKKTKTQLKSQDNVWKALFSSFLMVPSKNDDTLNRLAKNCKTSRKPEVKDCKWTKILGVMTSFIAFLCLLILFTKHEPVRNIKTNVFMCDKFGPPFKFQTTQAATPRLHRIFQVR